MVLAISGGLIAFLVILAALIGGCGYLLIRHYRTVGPNEVLIIFGGRKRTITRTDGTPLEVGYRTHVGGGTLVVPFMERAETLSMEIVTIALRTPEVLSRGGIPLIAEGVAQVKPGSDAGAIHAAAEQFLGRSSDDIGDIVHTVLEGHMRSTIGQMTAEEIYQDRSGFAKTVVKRTTEELKHMGLTILSFSLKDLTDTQGYLEALGQPVIARAKADAIVAQAEADRDATIKASEAKKQGDLAELMAHAEMAGQRMKVEGMAAEGRADVNRKKAEADLAYDLERFTREQELRRAEYEVKIVEKEKAIELEDKEIIRKEKELEATVRKPADARRYQVESEADAEQHRLTAEAKGRAEALQTEGAAEAEKALAVGKAEAEVMSGKAQSWAKYGDAAIAQMMADQMPELARAVAEPLSKVEKIIMLGDDNGVPKLTGQVTRVLAQLPEIIKSLSGVDLNEVIKNKVQSPEDEG
jgi:flotillin